MFMIVVYHYIFYGLKGNPYHQYYDMTSFKDIVNYVTMEPLYIISGVSVNCFVMITGYFLIEKMVFRLKGVLNIWIQTFFYSVLFLIAFYLGGSELINRGVDGERIIIVPNGVDPFLFNPSLDGRLIRNLYKVEDNIVLVSFVGSFGPWHGAELLASCVKKVVEQKQNVRFLFVGDGSRACDVKRIIEQDHMTDYVIMTGMISREMIRYYLAASDILVSPQVPNPDSTPFFGSPTKLFEYMAMGKAIAASDLDQIGEVLKTGDNAILFEAGNTKQLTDAILFLASDPAIRNKLGKNAREAVVKFYTWEAHLQAILDKINVI